MQSWNWEEKGVKRMIKFQVGFLVSLVVGVSSAESKEQVFYTEAIQSYHSRMLSQTPVPPGVIQREIVLLKAQTKITPHWIKPWNALVDIYISLGQYNQAINGIEKLLHFNPYDSSIQIKFIQALLTRYQTMESESEFYQNVLKHYKFNPEVRSSIYLKLAELSYEVYEADRAKRYIQYALKEYPQNVGAYELYSQIISEGVKNINEDFSWQIKENIARFEANPFDIIPAIELAKISAQLGLPKYVRMWSDCVFKIRKEFASNTDLPDEMILQLAEAYTVANLPKEAIKLLKSLKTYSEDANIKLSMLMIIADSLRGGKDISRRYTAKLVELVDDKTRLDRLSAEMLSRLSLFFNFNLNDIKRSTRLATLAYKKDAQNPLSTIAYTLALIYGGEFKEARKIIDQVDKRLPIGRLIWVKLLIAEGKIDEAKSLIRNALKTVPYGFIRKEFVKIAKQYKVDVISPDLSEARKLLTENDKIKKYLFLDHRKLLELKLSLKGQLSDGQVPKLSATCKNISGVTLISDTFGLIRPVVEITITAQSVNNNFIIEIPLNQRLILEPNNTVSNSSLLNLAIPVGKDMESFDSFIANISRRTRFITIGGKVYGTVLLPEPKRIVLCEFSPIKSLLPLIDGRTALSVIAQLRHNDLPADIWTLVRKIRWILISRNLRKYRDKLMSAIAYQIGNQTDTNRLSAFVWSAGFAGRGNAELLNALGKCITHKSWLVRFFAVDTIGKLQGRGAEKLYRFVSEKDSSELVRQLATSYLLR